jgi:hypothetical protein
MRDFRWVCGQVAEVQRFINVPRRWCEQYPARERRELWITAAQGPEFKFVVHTTLKPARRGHRVLALLMVRKLVALHNLQTGESVNCLRSDPPLLWRRCEVVAAVVALVVSVATFSFAGGMGPLCMATVTLLPVPLTASLRWGSHQRTSRWIDAALFEAIDQARMPSNPRPIFRRIK